MFNTLSFKIAFSYAVVIVFTSIIGFALLNVSIARFIHTQIDDELQDDIDEYLGIIEMESRDAALHYFDDGDHDGLLHFYSICRRNHGYNGNCIIYDYWICSLLLFNQFSNIRYFNHNF